MIKYFLFISAFLLSTYSYSSFNESKIDSLKTELSKVSSDQNKLELLKKLAGAYDSEYQDSLLNIANKVILLAEKLGDKCSMSSGYHYLGNYYYFISKNDTAISCFEKSLNIRKQHCSDTLVGSSLLMLGNVNNVMGKYDVASRNYHEALNIYDRLKDFHAISSIYSNIGIIHTEQEQYQEALKFYNKALKIDSTLNDKKLLATTLNAMGGVFESMENYDSSLFYFKNSMKLYEDIDYKKGLAHGYNNIGIVYYFQGDPDKCLEYFVKSYMMREALGNKMDIAQSLNNIGIFHNYQENYDLAIEYSEKSLKVAKEGKYMEEITEALLNLSEANSSIGNYKKANKQLNEYIAYKDTLFSEKNRNAIAEMEAKYESEKKEKEIALLNKNNHIKEKEIKHQNNLKLAFAAGFVLMLLLAFVIFRSLKQKQKAHALIIKQKKEVERQKEIVEEKNREILDSIEYAKRLQEAILPPKKLVKQYLENSFIFYRPKDIVAGDFYWMEKASVQNNGNSDALFFAVADCTGHGVPGAMVSVVCSNALNRSVNEMHISKPSDILEKVTDLVIETFEKSENNVKDGMDIALCKFDFKNNVLEYSGANNPLWIIREKEKEEHNDHTLLASKYELIEIKANRQPVGKYEHRTPFLNHNIYLNKGDLIYLFSDGYADQFGGEKGKKLKYKTLKNFLLEIADKPMDKQRELLVSKFDTWKGNFDQIDDVCIVGVKV